MSRLQELLDEEDRAWAGFREVADAFTPDQLLEPGYDPEAGWSAKDVLAHVACWAAMAVDRLEQVRMGTYEPQDLDVDKLNAHFYEDCRELSAHDVWAMLHSSRSRMLEELGNLPEGLADDAARHLFRENGAEHYAEHIERLREWREELAGA